MDIYTPSKNMIINYPIKYEIEIDKWKCEYNAE